MTALTPAQAEVIRLANRAAMLEHERDALRVAAHGLLRALLPITVPIAHRAQIRAAVQRLRTELDMAARQTGD